MVKKLFAVSSLLMSVGLATSIEAAPGKKKVALGYFDGASGAMLANTVQKGLRRRVEVVDNATWIAAGNRLRAVLATPEGQAKVAADLGVVGIIEGRFDREGRNWVATVTLRIPGGESPAPIALTNRSRRRILNTVRKQVWRKFRAAIQNAEPPRAGAVPPPPPPVVTKAPPTKASPASSSAAPPPSPSKDIAVRTQEPLRKPTGLRSESPVEVAVGFQWGARLFDYNDPLVGGLRPYQSFGVPAINGRITWYAASHFVDNFFARHIALDAAFGFALGLSSELEDGSQEFTTSANQFVISAKGRLPLDRHELSVLVGFAQESFDLDAGDLFPSVSYSAIRTGLAGRFFITDDIHISPELGYRFVVGSGDISGDGWFPNASTGGFDVNVVVGYHLFWLVEAQFQLGYRHYFFSLNPEVGDARVAGGALDQFINATAGLAFYLE